MNYGRLVEVGAADEAEMGEIRYTELEIKALAQCVGVAGREYAARHQFFDRRKCSAFPK